VGEWLGNEAQGTFQMTLELNLMKTPYNPDGPLNFGPSTQFKSSASSQSWRVSRILSSKAKLK